MSHSNDIGISPVILQAISQSIKSTKTSAQPTKRSLIMENENFNHDSDTEQQDLYANILKQDKGKSEKFEKDKSAAAKSDTIKTMLKIKMAANALSKAIFTDSLAASEPDLPKTNAIESSASDLAMANMLTAFATQNSAVKKVDKMLTPAHTKGMVVREPEYRAVKIPGEKFLIQTNNGEESNFSLNHQSCALKTISPKLVVTEHGSMYTIIKTETGMDLRKPVQLQFHSQPSVSSVSNISMESSDCSSYVGYSLFNCEKSNLANSSSLTSCTQSPPITTSSSHNTSQLAFSFHPLPGPSGIQTSSQSLLDSPQIKVIEHQGKQYIMQTQNFVPQASSSTKYLTHCSSSEPTETGDARAYTVELDGEGMTYTGVVEEQEVVTLGQQQDESSPSLPSHGGNYLATGVPSSPCPICGDSISGFHYGIFTCESCKGFFKRTVQNKKSFVCPRQGECEITLENRKKCPACRFAKCLVMGMKLEAIRLDRTRGGRSSYGGATLSEKKHRPIKIMQRTMSNTSFAKSTLASVLNGSSKAEKPYVPQILTDILNLESLLCDDDIPQSISTEDLTPENPNVFLTLLQLCELKLYKIVRWARNLPYFANISTDDQILLLQNCWCELLGLTLCWKSLQLTGEIIFFHGQAVDFQQADALNLGQMFNKMLDVVDHFKRMKLDQYECVALKVLILICPDIKGLTDADTLSDQQQKVGIALENYTSGHYRSTPNKYGEVLLRLPELSRISCMLKEHLMKWMTPNATSCGLLYELLKGENMKDLG